jgi:ketosteroid isomerase-like protein
MGTLENKALVRKAYEGLSLSDSVFLDCLSEDATWTFFGNHIFAGTFNGKQDIVDRLLTPIANVVESFKFHVDNLIAEGDQVVVEGRGEAPTKDGGSYNNSYCIVVTVHDGRISKICEHLDSELVTSTFGARR